MVVMADTIRTMSVLFNMGEARVSLSNHTSYIPQLTSVSSPVSRIRNLFQMPARDSVKIQRRVESNVPFIIQFLSI